MPQKTPALPIPKSKTQNRSSKTQASSKGPSHTVPSNGTSNSNSIPKTNPLPHSIQQNILSTFSSSLPALSNSSAEEINATIQTIKSHLYTRDFSEAFGSEKNLEAYAFRWSVGRALGYADLFVNVGSVREVLEGGLEEVEVICLGGAAAELVAFAACVRVLEDERKKKDDAKSSGNWTIHLIDIAAWGQIITSLTSALSCQPTPLLSSQDLLSAEWYQQDLLSPIIGDETKDTINYRIPKAKLITIMFTLNELYCFSISKTTASLLRITTAARKGTILLVVDSPGSYSTVKIGSEEKRYPMHWLLDHTLLEAASLDEGVIGNGNEKQKGKVKQWEKVVEDESRWFRRAKGLEYPIELEDMRYQMHVYRRI